MPLFLRQRWFRMDLMPAKAGAWTQNGADGADPVGSRVDARVAGADDVPSHLSAFFSVSGTPLSVFGKATS